MRSDSGWPSAGPQAPGRRRCRRSLELSFVSPSTGYVLDLAGDLLGARNQGRTWTKVPSLSLDNVEGVSFSSPKNGMVTLGTQGSLGSLLFDVLATTDGGATWQSEVIDGGSASPEASHLSISIGAKKLTARALKAKHRSRVTIRAS